MTMVTKERAQEIDAAARRGADVLDMLRGEARDSTDTAYIDGMCRVLSVLPHGVDGGIVDLAATVVAQADELARLRETADALRESATDALRAAERALTARDEARAEVGRLRALALDPVDALNAAVTAAILRAERLTREGADATAAYADVARYEAALAALHPADTVEGETAREGVRLAVIGCAPVGGSEESGWMLGCDVGGMRVGDPPGQWGGAGRPRPEAVTAFGWCARVVARARAGAGA